MDRAKLSSLNRGLLVTAILVTSLATAATWVGFRATDDVSAQTNTLVAQQIPQLRSISGLQDQINRRVLELYLYYASSDTRCHVATTTVERLVDYCRNTPPDPLFTAKCVEQRIELIDKNLTQ